MSDNHLLSNRVARKMVFSAPDVNLTLRFESILSPAKSCLQPMTDCDNGKILVFDSVPTFSRIDEATPADDGRGIFLKLTRR